jgi:hypothetical protein
VREASGGDAICGGTHAVGATELLPYLRCIAWADSSRQQQGQLRFNPPAPFSWGDGTNNSERRQVTRNQFSGTTRTGYVEELEIDRGSAGRVELGGGRGLLQDRDEVEDDDIEDW